MKLPSTDVKIMFFKSVNTEWFQTEIITLKSGTLSTSFLPYKTTVKNCQKLTKSVKTQDKTVKTSILQYTM